MKKKPFVTLEKLQEITEKYPTPKKEFAKMQKH